MLELIDFVEKKIIRVGAEAVIKEVYWKNFRLVKKHRIPKRYRDETIDTRVRRSRTFHEAKVLTYLSENGLPVPLLLFIDPGDSAIYMQFIEGIEMKDEQEAIVKAELLGKLVAEIHTLGIAHGDLTLSNILVDQQGRLWFVDFGLSVFDADLEEKAVDIHLIERSVEATYSNKSREFFKAFLRGYRSVEGNEGTRAVVEKVREIRRRGRYVAR